MSKLGYVALGSLLGASAVVGANMVIKQRERSRETLRTFIDNESSQTRLATRGKSLELRSKILRVMRLTPVAMKTVIDTLELSALPSDVSEQFQLLKRRAELVADFHSRGEYNAASDIVFAIARTAIQLRDKPYNEDVRCVANICTKLAVKVMQLRSHLDTGRVGGYPLDDVTEELVSSLKQSAPAHFYSDLMQIEELVLSLKILDYLALVPGCV